MNQELDNGVFIFSDNDSEEREGDRVELDYGRGTLSVYGFDAPNGHVELKGLSQAFLDASRELLSGSVLGATSAGLNDTLLSRQNLLVALHGMLSITKKSLNRFADAPFDLDGQLKELFRSLVYMDQDYKMPIELALFLSTLMELAKQIAYNVEVFVGGFGKDADLFLSVWEGIDDEAIESATEIAEALKKR